MSVLGVSHWGSSVSMQPENVNASVSMIFRVESDCSLLIVSVFSWVFVPRFFFHFIELTEAYIAIIVAKQVSKANQLIVKTPAPMDFCTALHHYL